MRNYVALNFCRLNFNNASPGDPPNESRWISGTSAEDLAAQIEWAKAAIPIAFLPPDGGVEDLGIWYFPLDKANISRTWNYNNIGHPLSGPIYQRDPFSDNSPYDPNNPPSNSPNKGFTDVNGQQRGEESVEGKGPKGRFQDMAQLLLTIYAILYAKGGIYKAAASHIPPVIAKIYNHTVTQADIDALFAFLHKFGV